LAADAGSDRWSSLRSGLRRQSFTVRPASTRFGRAQLDAYLKALGRDGGVARDLDTEVEAAMSAVSSLSSLTSMVAVQYMDRLGRPIPSLTPQIGVQIVGRAYVAHLVVERDPGRFGAADVPVLGTLPPLRKGRPPQDLLSRVVKASRGRGFELICALTPRGWDGLVRCLTKRAHDMAQDTEELVPVEVVDGVARFAWVLRQTDLHYGLQPEPGFSD
jgi:hypothetical protein